MSTAPNSPNKRTTSPTATEESGTPKRTRVAEVYEASQDPRADELDEMERAAVQVPLPRAEVEAPEACGILPTDLGVIHFSDGEADDVVTGAALRYLAEADGRKFASVLAIKKEHDVGGEFELVGLSKIMMDRRVFYPSGTAARVHWHQPGDRGADAQLIWASLGFPEPPAKDAPGPAHFVCTLHATGPLWGFGETVIKDACKRYNATGRTLRFVVVYYGAAYNNENGLTDEIAELYRSGVVSDVEVYSRTQTVGRAHDASYRNLACFSPHWMTSVPARRLGEFMRYFLVAQTSTSKIFAPKNAPVVPGDLEIWEQAKRALGDFVGVKTGLAAYEARQAFFTSPEWRDFFVTQVKPTYRAMLGVADTSTYKAGDPLEALPAPLLADQLTVLRHFMPEGHLLERVEGNVVKAGNFVNVVPGAPIDGAPRATTYVLINPESAKTKEATYKALMRMYALFGQLLENPSNLFLVD